MSNHSHPFDWQLKRMRRRKMTALGFGGGLTLMMMVPILNFAAMPAAVIGATKLWCEHKSALEAE
jgi:CysZ protein